MLLPYLLLISIIGSWAQDCRMAEMEDCLRRVDERIVAGKDNPTEFCKNDGDIVQDLDSCVSDTINCDESQINEVIGRRDVLVDNLETLCEDITQPPVTTPPVPKIQCDDDIWATFNGRLLSCKDSWDELDELKYNDRLTKYGICKSMQTKLDCMYNLPYLTECGMVWNATNREAVDQIKFAHIFDCEVTVNGIQISPDKSENRCSFWDWLQCHDSLLSAVRLEKVSPSMDIQEIREFRPSTILLGIAKNDTSCSKYSKIDFSAIRSCRDRLRDRCDTVAVPRRDSTWDGVLGLLYDVSNGPMRIVNSLLQIEKICAKGCNNFFDRMSAASTCKTKHSALQNQIITKFTNSQDLKAECMELSSYRDCLYSPDVFGDCEFVKDFVVTDIHGNNVWKMVLDICQIDIGVKAKPGCFNERASESKIITDCSPQTRKTLQTALLKPDSQEGVFCAILQLSVNCYAQHVSICPALERQYWAADTTMIHAANTMLPSCNIKYQTMGNVPIKAITDCDVTGWVGCLGPLWVALGVDIINGQLDVAGFQALLDLAWNVDENKNNICSKVTNLDFAAMEGCVAKKDMTCKIPMLTLDDGVDYETKVIDPFNITQIKNYVKKACTSGCTDGTLVRKLQDCLDSKGDSSVILTYPLDIIYNGYVDKRNHTKCRSMDDIIGCTDHTLRKCEPFQEAFTLLRTRPIQEATDVCNRRDWDTSPTKPCCGATGLVSSIVLLMICVVIRFFV